MTYTFKLSRRLALSHYSGMLALLALLSAACADNLPLDNTDAGSTGAHEAHFEVFPRLVYAEVNQPIQLQARTELAERDGAPVAVEWTASGGSITAEGVFSSSAVGEYKVVGRGRGKRKTDTTTVVVVDSVPDLVALVLAPDTASLLPAETRHFDAEGERSDGSLTRVGALWTAEGGSIDAGGNYVAGPVPGHYRVIASSVNGSLADTAVVAVSSPLPTPIALEMSPAAVTLTAGSSQQFSAAVRLSDSSTTAAEVEFTATGGTISSAGLFTAPTSAGPYRVIATTASGLSDTAAVSVVAAAVGPVIEPGANVQAAVDANPPGTAFLLKAGTHRLQQIRPKDGNSFIGEAGAVLSGARLLTSFSRSGSYWVASGQSQEGIVRGTCQTGFEGCAYPEDLFIDDVPLRHVTSLSQVTADAWFFDYTADKIYLGTDPTNRKVETSVLPDAFDGNSGSVTIKGLVIEKYANPAQHGAVHGHESRNWIVEGNEIRWNHGTGLRTGDGMRVVGNSVHHNGQLGMGGTGTSVLIEGNEIAYNNTAGYKVGWEGGGTKFVKTDGLVVRRNRVHDNWGNGLWTDIDNIRSLIEDNLVVGNTYQGIFHEISYDAVIRNNTVEGNGFGHQGWLFGSGILVAASPNVEIYGNIVRNNFNGITGVQQNRGTGRYGPHEISNLYVHDNVITMPSGKTGLAQDVGDDSYFQNRNNRWASNTYYLGTGARFAWMGATISEAQWRGYGQDVNGTFQKQN